MGDLGVGLPRRVRRPTARPTFSGRRWLPRLRVLAIALLTAADIVLVKLAFDTAGRPPEGFDRTVAAVTPNPPTQSAASSPALKALPEGPLHLAVAADGAVLLGSAGGCPEAAAADSLATLVSDAPGRPLRPVTVDENLTGVLAVDAASRDNLTVVGSDDGCEVRAYHGSAGRDVWRPRSAEAHWYLGLARTVHAPGGDIEVPCTPAALSTTVAVRLLCDSGALLGTTDGGETWVALGRVDGASAFAFDGPSNGVALVTLDDCPVALATTNNGGAGWETAGCLEDSPGRAVDVRGEDVAAVVGDTLWRSADGGETWERSAD